MIDGKRRPQETSSCSPWGSSNQNSSAFSLYPYIPSSSPIISFPRAAAAFSIPSLWKPLVYTRPQSIQSRGLYFVADPQTFLTIWTVDNTLVQRTMNAGTWCAQLNVAKPCYFQMAEVSTTILGFGTNKVELTLGANASDVPKIGLDFAVGA
jgi:hypothetical protein